MTAPIRIGLLIFPRMTQLDLTGPYEVLTRLPGAEVLLLWKTLQPVEADSGLRILPHTTLTDCGQLDVICVPGGPGVAALMEDQTILDFLRRQAETARFISSVCTGSLVLGAAGLLRGKRATSHWNARDFLAPLGAIPTAGRTVRDGRVITGGGVTAGIDFALAMVAELADPATAEAIQLMIEYAPAPSDPADLLATASPEVLAQLQARAAPLRAERAALVARVAARLQAAATP